MIMEKIADRYENAMKKGFIHTIILSTLHHTPCHGYQIKKSILNSSLGSWDIPDSTLYTVLKQLTQKELIEFKEEWVGERKKKVYNLTQKGYDLFNLINERQSRIFNSIFSLMNQLLPDPDDDMYKNIELAQKLSPISPDFDFLKNKAPSEKIKILTDLKFRLSQQIGFFQEMIKNIDIRVDLLENS